MLNCLITVIGIWLLWFIVGCAVLSAIDDADQRLFKWASSCPLPGGYVLTVTMWPIIFWFWHRSRKDAH